MFICLEMVLYRVRYKPFNDKLDIEQEYCHNSDGVLYNMSEGSFVAAGKSEEWVREFFTRSLHGEILEEVRE